MKVLMLNGSCNPKGCTYDSRRHRELAYFYYRCRYMGSRRNLQLYRGERIAQRQTHHPLHRSGSGSGSVAESIPFTAHNKQGSCPPKGNPKTIGFWRKPPKRHLWRMKRGGFEEVSRFSRHNVAGNRLTRR